jgi:hypothetical protein
MFNYGYDHGIERLNFTTKKGDFFNAIFPFPFYFSHFCTKQYGSYLRQHGFKT